MPKNWCVTTLKDIFRINPRNRADDDLIAGFVPMTKIAEGFNNQFSFEEKAWRKIKTGFTHFQNGDVVVAKISPCLENRKSVVINNLPNGIGAGTTELHVFRSEVVNPLFALYFFKTQYFINQCTSTFNGVVGQQRVGKNIIENITFFLPSMKEQQRITSKIREILSNLDKISEAF